MVRHLLPRHNTYVSIRDLGDFLRLLIFSLFPVPIKRVLGSAMEHQEIPSS